MEIKICTTKEWTKEEWFTYTIGFGEVFKKKTSISYFQRKYTNVEGGTSYHALLKDEKVGVVGGCTILPCLYERNKEPFLIGLAVDVFIRENYRTDPLMLRKMYKRLCILLIQKNIVAVMAVPNATAYPYWKNVVKWKDVGIINYWMLPVRIGNILKRWKLLNAFSLFYTHLMIGLSVSVAIYDFSTYNYTYKISPEGGFMQHRYEDGYTIYKDDIYFYAFRIVDEEGIKTAYILDATKCGKRTTAAFLKAVKHILQGNIDLILYIGKVGCFQSLFFKTPRKLEPKALHLTCDLLSSEKKYADIYNIKKWDFGLKNYDVR